MPAPVALRTLQAYLDSKGRAASRSALLALGLPLAVACGGAATKPPPPPPVRGPAPLAPVGSASGSSSVSSPPIELSERDFTSSEGNRDPFRAYASLFQHQITKPVANQEHVIAQSFALDELKLVAIVTGNTAPRAMLVDPQGKGHIISRGELVGRTESVRVGGINGADYDLSWKVDRIRAGDVVFVRETPGSATPSATKVIALRPQGESPEGADTASP